MCEFERKRGKQKAEAVKSNSDSSTCKDKDKNMSAESIVFEKNPDGLQKEKCYIASP